ncbi:MAG: hypothetical protein DRP11_00265 [Candidatus Aenigmatarchaeota archaeon]|nr:MAG: hypothetical protein DRP11_00265 [Candidatus Aenigmarchaeota archaeon]
MPKKVEDLFFDYEPAENEDWNFARNLFTVLKRPQGTWSQSVFSVSFNGYVTPNRDYPYQGLFARVEGENWKFLDSLMFRVNRDGEDITLQNGTVRVWPWKVMYTYTSDECELLVTYYLLSKKWENELGAVVDIGLKRKKPGNYKILVSPLVDIRFMYDQSGKGYSVEESGGVLTVSRAGRSVTLGPVYDFRHKEKEVEWIYKLGVGEREIKDDKVFFRKTDMKPVQIGEMIFPQRRMRLGLVCGREGYVRSALRDVLSDKNNEYLERKRLEKKLERFRISTGDRRLNRFFAARKLTFDGFGLIENSIEIPEAGDFWFRTVWFRDLFEGLFHNMDVYLKMKGKEWVRKILQWASVFLKDGRMPVKISERGDKPIYGSIDGALLYVLSIYRYLRLSRDKKHEKVLRKLALTAITEIMESMDTETGLLHTRADDSWIDTKKTVNGKTVSTRIPDEWVGKIKNIENELFLLPEVNALWLRVIEERNRFEGEKVLKNLGSNYRKVFWDPKDSFIYGIVWGNMKDRTRTSMGVASLALLSHHFTKKELEKAWNVIEKELLVKREPLLFDKGQIPFGILVKNSDKRIFLGDDSYHEAVIWMRTTPYLIKLLKDIGKEDVVKDILLNTLDHQMSEGAIFYSHELFSLPEGGNPSPKGPKNPVPVKNPIQYWSHFVEPFYR